MTTNEREEVQRISGALSLLGVDVLKEVLAQLEQQGSSCERLACAPVVGGGEVEEKGAFDGVSKSVDWSDETSESVGSVSGVPIAGDKVRKTVVFGGFGAAVSMSPGSGSAGGMAQYVKTSGARGVRAELMKIGIKMPKASSWHLAMITHTAATMPEFFTRGKDKLRTFAVLGDSALVAAVASEAIGCGQALDSVQRLRTTALTDAVLGRAFAKSGFASFVSLASGVDFVHSKTGATALEALVGLVAYYRSPADVLVLVGSFGLLKYSSVT